jgi:hypothetical protein
MGMSALVVFLLLTNSIEPKGIVWLFWETDSGLKWATIFRFSVPPQGGFAQMIYALS